MSGIAGLYYLDGRPLSRRELADMMTAIAHRGQCQEITIKGSVGLGQRKGEAAPTVSRLQERWVSPKTSLSITADARLDNREELFASLGVRSTALSDADLILRAYAEWGTECPKRFLGDFAFAIWDARQRKLFCARDHIGIRPLYYYRSSILFAFASEIKALLCVEEIPRRLNEIRVGDYLLPLFDDKEITFFDGIFRLPPGHWALVCEGGIHLERYWSLDTARETRFGSDDEYAEAYRQVFMDAVRCRIGDVPRVGSFLSGGLDSSSITCVSRTLLTEMGVTPFPTFSAIFPDVPQCDERPFIQAVHDQGGYDPHFVRGDRISPLHDFHAVMRHQDEPFYAPNLFIHYAIYRQAAQANVPHLLDGFDGDTTVSHGLVSMAEQARAGEWRALLSNVQGLAEHSGQPAFRIARIYVMGSLAPNRLRAAWRWLKACGDPVAGMNPTIRPCFAKRIHLTERCIRLEPEWFNPPQTEKQHHYRRLTWGILPFVLEVLDRASAAYGIEQRYPFCDTRMLEFCYSLPPAQKLYGGWSRWIARRAMKGILPDRIRWRGRKANLGANFTRSLLHFERDTMDRIILKEPGVVEGYVDIARLREVYDRFQAKPSQGDAMTIWKVVTLALWLEYAFSPLGTPAS